jgi:hypothetical protein
VTEAGRAEQLTDGRWLNLRGMPLRADGSQLRAEAARGLSVNGLTTHRQRLRLT